MCYYLRLSYEYHLECHQACLFSEGQNEVKVNDTRNLFILKYFRCSDGACSPHKRCTLLRPLPRAVGWPSQLWREEASVVSLCLPVSLGTVKLWPQKGKELNIADSIEASYVAFYDALPYSSGKFSFTSRVNFAQQWFSTSLHLFNFVSLKVYFSDLFHFSCSKIL